MPVVWSPAHNGDIGGDNAVTYSYAEGSHGGSSSNLLEQALNSIDLLVKDKPLKLKPLRSFPSPPTFNQLSKSLLYNLIKYPIPMEISTCQHLSNFIEIQMSQLNSYIKGEQDRIMSEFSSQVNLLNSVLIHNYTGGKQLRIKRGTDTNLLKKLLDFSKSLKDRLWL